EAIGDAGVFDAVVEMDTVAAVFGDRQSVQVNLVDVVGVNAVPALFVARHAEVGQLDPPEPLVPRSFVTGGMADEDRGLPVGVRVVQVRRRSCTTNEHVASRQNER